MTMEPKEAPKEVEASNESSDHAASDALKHTASPTSVPATPKPPTTSTMPTDLSKVSDEELYALSLDDWGCDEPMRTFTHDELTQLWKETECRWAAEREEHKRLEATLPKLETHSFRVWTFLDEIEHPAAGWDPTATPAQGTQHKSPIARDFSDLSDGELFRLTEDDGEIYGEKPLVIYFTRDDIVGLDGESRRRRKKVYERLEAEKVKVKRLERLYEAHRMHALRMRFYTG